MFIFDKQFATNRNHKAQYAHVVNHRRTFNAMEKAFAQLTGNAAAIIPQDVYREFENQTKAVMRSDNQVLVRDLMPLAKALPVGKIEHVYRQASDAGIVTVSLSGQSAVDIDKTAYDYDSSIKVIHQAGFGRSWMEMEGQRTEGFDALVDDQANVSRAVLDSIAGHIYDGKDVTFKGIDAYGIKTSSKVQAVDLDASDLNINFTTSTTPSAIRAAWIKLVDKLRINNNVNQPITFYVSSGIESNFLQYYGTDAGDTGKTVLQTLKELPGVADIKMDRSLTGNEVVGVVLDSQFIRPLIGMAVTTVPLFRANPMDNYNFMVWANVGLEIRTDYAGRTGVLYAREIA
jgi:hypothetical protein